MKKRLEVNSPEYKDLVSKLTSNKPLINLPPLPPQHTIPIPESPRLTETKLPPISQIKLPISDVKRLEVKLPRISDVKRAEVKLPPISDVKRAEVKKSPALQRKFLSGVKDVDLLILMDLDDESLFSACQVNKDAARICQDEIFWRTRFLNKYGNFNKAGNMTWRELYLKAGKGYNLFRKGLTIDGYVAKDKLNENDELLLVNLDMFPFKKTKFDWRELTVLINNKFLFKKNVPTAKNYHTESPFFEDRSRLNKWIKENYKNTDPRRFDKNSFDRFRFYI